MAIHLDSCRRSMTSCKILTADKCIHDEQSNYKVRSLMVSMYTLLHSHLQNGLRSLLIRAAGEVLYASLFDDRHVPMSSTSYSACTIESYSHQEVFE